MLLKVAKTISIGDIVRVKGTTGKDEGKLGKIVAVVDWGNRVSFHIKCIDDLWDGDLITRTMNHHKLELVEKKKHLK